MWAVFRIPLPANKAEKCSTVVEEGLFQQQTLLAHLQHVRDIKERAVPPCMKMRFNMTFPVLYRQTPTRKCHHFPAMGQVEVMERSPAELILWAARFSAIRALVRGCIPPPPSKTSSKRPTNTLYPTCAQLRGRPGTEGIACRRKPKGATMLLARCIVACN